MKKNSLLNSVWFRLVIISFLTVLLMIPATIISGLINERQNRFDDVFSEIASKWGDSQTVTGPILSVPYTTTSVKKLENGEEKMIRTVRNIHILPEDLEMDVKLDPHKRYRGIYEVVVYNATINIRGHFAPYHFTSKHIPEGSIDWNEANIAVGVFDKKGIKERVHIKLNEKSFAMNPGAGDNEILSAGFNQYPRNYNPKETTEFSITINLNGSRNLSFRPVGKETRVNITSEWANPSFVGSFLPNSRVVNEDGFKASWKVFDVNRNYPQYWIGKSYRIDTLDFGVKLLVGVNEYQKTMRTAKYAIMVISLTFLTFFMIELLNGKAIHPIQYLLTGFALIVFYSLLLSISEHLGFGLAYLISSIATIALIVVYLKSTLQSLKHTTAVAGVLILLYSYMYFILQLQDYALMVGSIGLFTILATIMYLTRKTNWSGGMSNT